MPFPALSLEDKEKRGACGCGRERGHGCGFAVMWCSERFERFVALDAADARCITGVLVVLEGCHG